MKYSICRWLRNRRRLRRLRQEQKLFEIVMARLANPNKEKKS